MSGGLFMATLSAVSSHGAAETTLTFRYKFQNMYSYRSKASQSTPANVQCQKCLKRDMISLTYQSDNSTDLLERHYSYECKASAQERPYVSRPSRSQQLRNPKLVPKLTNDVPNPLEKKYASTNDQTLPSFRAYRSIGRALQTKSLPRRRQREIESAN